MTVPAVIPRESASAEVLLFFVLSPCGKHRVPHLRILKVATAFVAQGAPPSSRGPWGICGYPILRGFCEGWADICGEGRRQGQGPLLSSGASPR